MDLKATKKDAETIKRTFPTQFDLFQLAGAFKMSADDATGVIAKMKAYGFLNETNGKFDIVLNPDQRSINLTKNIQAIDDQIKVFKEAKKEAISINSATFAEKLKP